MKILVTGSKFGLGHCIVNALMDYHHDVITYDITDGHDVLKPDVGYLTELDVLINNAGVNGIDWLENVKEADWDRIMGVNAKGIFLMTQACLPLLIKSQGTVLNIVSNASHMPMTNSLCYNASKGAAHIMTLQLARELTKRYGITVFGVAPNRLDGTEMSKSIDKQVAHVRDWDKDAVSQRQRDALLAGEETPPQEVAEFIAFLLAKKSRHRYLTGTVIPYGC